MKKKESYKIIGVIALLVSIVALSISYAAINTTLKINGDAKVIGSNWKIKYANLDLTKTVLNGHASEVVAPSITTNDTKIGDYSVNLKAPGDYVKYFFDVVNDGTFDAEITSLTIPTPKCTGTGENALTDAQNVCNNLTYTLTYDDNTPVSVGDILLNKEESNHVKHLILTLTYKDTVTSDLLPKEDVTISNLEIITIYSQR